MKKHKQRTQQTHCGNVKMKTVIVTTISNSVVHVMSDEVDGRWSIDDHIQENGRGVIQLLQKNLNLID
jgi:hypothetical protein